MKPPRELAHSPHLCVNDKLLWWAVWLLPQEEMGVVASILFSRCSGLSVGLRKVCPLLPTSWFVV